jgi:DNA-binding transcriptional LysR family regulator
MQVFVKVVENGSFAGAAAKLDATPSMVTKHVNRLEAHLGVRLLNRTTRRVSLTEPGSAYYERCVRLLAELDETEAVVGRHGAEPHGTLRLTAPTEFAGLHLGRPIAAFMRRYPEVNVDLSCTNRVVDLVEEGYDAGVRAARRLEGDFVARRIASSQLLVVAAPAYLRAHGVPRTPAELERQASACATGCAPTRASCSSTRRATGTASASCRASSPGPSCARAGCAGCCRTSISGPSGSTSSTRTAGSCTRRCAPSSTSWPAGSGATPTRTRSCAEPGRVPHGARKGVDAATASA